MTKEELFKEFRSKHTDFLYQCDITEKDGAWDKEEYGEMEAYFGSNLLVVAMRLAMADSKVTEEEIEYFNELFGYGYTPEELQNVYESSQEEIELVCEENVKSRYEMLKTIDADMAFQYIDLVHSICKIIPESNEVFSQVEVDLAEKLISIGE